MVGTYVPRKCGLATFTHDLADALEAELAGCPVTVVAMDDTDKGYAYPKRVKFQIRQSSLPDYLRAAEYLNVNQADLAVVQHEYGIFGGRSGGHVLHLVRNLRMPVVTVLHTLLTEPSEQQGSILLELAEHSEQLVVMTDKGREILRDVYDVPDAKITRIPHGIPDFAFVDPSFYKDTFGVENRTVLLSFGLLHPGKGFELVIQALPEVLKRHPNLIYIILGATHPHVIKHTGDAYRHSLHQLVGRLGLESHVRFDNKYTGTDELCRYIGAADLFISPYLSPDQITSGTLSYAVGAGKAVISTPYWHAEELLAEGRGRLVPFGDVDAMARTIIDVLDNEPERNAMRKRAYQFGRQMVWKEVARGYVDLFARVLERPMSRPRAFHADYPTRMVEQLPRLNLQHLLLITDDTGILQHCVYTTPNREHGYCTDDQARALIATTMCHSLFENKMVIPLIQKYLAFLFHAFNRENGRFRNFMSYDRHWLETAGSEDAHGRALWSLGVVVRDAPNDAVHFLAARLFNEGLGAIEPFTSPRAWAYALVGLHSYMEAYAGDAEARRLRDLLTDRLYRAFRENADAGWLWCEDVVTYDNAKLPHALLVAGRRIPDSGIFWTGLQTLEWLLEQQTAENGHLCLIGNAGWLTREGRRSNFDQQPLDAMALVEACIEAFRGTGDFRWIVEARRCLNWFLGFNDLNLPLYDFTTGGCYDGLTPQGVNANQGAESTLAWLISLLTMFEAVGQQVPKEGNGANGGRLVDGRTDAWPL
jgi:glycosyltransferase involved in cell wall biosynthesis